MTRLRQTSRFNKVVTQSSPAMQTCRPTASSSSRYRPFGWEGSSQRPTDRTPNLTSLIQMGARPYAPQIGRFLAVDPVEGGATTNPYGYVNDPYNFEDLNGMWGWSSVAKVVAAAVVVVVVVAVIVVAAPAVAAGGAAASVAIVGGGTAAVTTGSAVATTALVVGGAYMGAKVVEETNEIINTYEAEHTKNARQSTENVHQEAQARKQREQAKSNNKNKNRDKPKRQGKRRRNGSR